MGNKCKKVKFTREPRERVLQKSIINNIIVINKVPPPSWEVLNVLHFSKLTRKECAH